MSEVDRWSKWTKRMPFSRSDPFDIQETFQEMEEMVAQEFEELSREPSKPYNENKN